MTAAPIQTVRLPHCTAQPTEVAAAFCTCCRLPYSGQFLAVRLDGRSVCHACVEREEIAVDRPQTERPRDPLASAGWRRTLVVVLTRPASLGQEYRGPIAEAVGLGLLWTTIGYALNTAWAMIWRGAELVALFEEQLGDELPAEMLPWIPWMALPFTVLLRQIAGATLFHVGLRAAGASSEQWRAHLRVFSLASITLLLSVIPVFGSALSLVLFFTAMLAYARRSYGLSAWRTLLALLPCYLLIALLDIR